MPLEEALTECSDCDSPDKVKRVFILTIDHGGLLNKADRYQYQVMPYCEHSKIADFPLFAEESSRDKIRKRASELCQQYKDEKWMYDKTLDCVRTPAELGIKRREHIDNWLARAQKANWAAKDKDRNTH